MHETFKFEVILHFEGEDGAEMSIEVMKRLLAYGATNSTGANDCEVDLIERTAE